MIENITKNEIIIVLVSLSRLLGYKKNILRLKPYFSEIDLYLKCGII
ncbi:hypothetical protein KYB31_23275 [Clostridium felsineum]|nr:hypothetical protein [Clostridium felsineum]MCR3761900.1 hypothetical protein [Clostridium felsineum]